MPVPVIDLFAGPGGLGEGFSSVEGTGTGRRFFELRLSVEKEPTAHQTLQLRSFFRKFPSNGVPDDYYRHLRGQIARDELFASYPRQAEAARREAWHAELGSAEVTKQELDTRVAHAVGGRSDWVLIGGPPCQAYSVAGRSRNKGVRGYTLESDSRHSLYEQYLHLLADHRPAVFVMENVTGILSSRVNGQPIFQRILEDLREPGHTRGKHAPHPQPRGTYRIYSLVRQSEGFDIFGFPNHDPRDYVIECERYGVPQARHRVILLGVRGDIPFEPAILEARGFPVTAGAVLKGLPRLRSGLSHASDTRGEWRDTVRGVLKAPWLADVRKSACQKVLDLLIRTARNITVPRLDRGGEFVACNTDVPYMRAWFVDPRIGGVCNSTTRQHIREDLYRYVYAACFAKVYGYSPRIGDFPKALHPDHRNVLRSLGHDNFADRFRVQRAEEPATTVVSHISKDGHYYIHPDPGQCRSLTVREVARLQTFPDNYYFCGNRTEQYTQVGNAVPPLLARQIAEVVKNLVCRARKIRTDGHADKTTPQLEHVEDQG